jgi:hypothetical protein
MVISTTQRRLMTAGSTYGAVRPDAVVWTVDPVKRDVEIKILFGCTEDEQQAIVRFHTSDITGAALTSPAGGEEETGSGQVLRCFSQGRIALRPYISII